MKLNINRDYMFQWYQSAPRPLEEFVAASEDAFSKPLLGSESLELRQISLPHVQTLMINIMELVKEEDSSSTDFVEGITTIMLQYGLWSQAATLYQARLREFKANLAYDPVGIDLYLRLGDMAEAERLQGLYVQWAKTSLGEFDLDTLYGIFDLAEVYLWQDRFSDAKDLLLQVTKATMNESHPSHEDLNLRARLELGWIEFQDSPMTETLSRQLHLVEDAKAFWGPSHSQTVAAKNVLALMYIGAGQSMKAQVILESLVEEVASTLGPNHPTALVYKNNLALNYAAQGFFELSLDMFSKVIKGWQETMPNHAALALSKNDMAEVLNLMGNIDLARDYQRQAQDTGLSKNASRQLRRGWGSAASKSYYSPHSWLFMVLAVVFRSTKALFLHTVTFILQKSMALLMIWSLGFSGFVAEWRWVETGFQETFEVANRAEVYNWTIDKQKILDWDPVSPENPTENCWWGFQPIWPLYTYLIFIFSDIHL
jgi:tetratricopeptide (TPR) repeat protein